jgi:hypothetical protein
MRLSLKALAITSALLWGGCILLTGLVNLASPEYGFSFLQMVSSVYPGYHVTHSIGSVLAGTGYALVDGAFGGLLFGWLYNAFAGSQLGTKAVVGQERALPR